MQPDNEKITNQSLLLVFSNDSHLHPFVSVCEDCHELYEDDCPSHPLTIIGDTPVPEKCKNRAKLSLPQGLTLKEASIEGAGKGVWAQRFFPRGVRFGPYGGEIVVNEKAGRESGYSWEVCIEFMSS